MWTVAQVDLYVDAFNDGPMDPPWVGIAIGVVCAVLFVVCMIYYARKDKIGPLPGDRD